MLCASGKRLNGDLLHAQRRRPSRCHLSREKDKYFGVGLPLAPRGAVQGLNKRQRSTTNATPSRPACELRILSNCRKRADQRPPWFMCLDFIAILCRGVSVRESCARFIELSPLVQRGTALHIHFPTRPFTPGVPLTHFSSPLPVPTRALKPTLRPCNSCRAEIGRTRVELKPRQDPQRGRNARSRHVRGWPNAAVR